MSSNKKFILLAAVIIFIFIASISSKRSTPPQIAYKLNFVEQNIVDALTASEVDSIVNNGNAIITLNDVGIDAVLTATELAKEYNANEVAADNKFRNKQILVRGKVSSIDKDVFDKPVLRLKGTNMFSDVTAYMDKKEVPLLANMSKGQKTQLICEGNGFSIGSPMLADCEEAYGKLTAIVSSATNDFLNGKRQQDTLQAMLVSIGIYVTTILPNNSACEESPDEKCLNAITAALKAKKIDKLRNNAQYVAIIDKMQQLGMLDAPTAIKIKSGEAVK